MTAITAPPLAGLWTRIRAALAPTPRVSLADALEAHHRAAVADADARLADLERRLDALRKDGPE